MHIGLRHTRSSVPHFLNCLKVAACSTRFSRQTGQLLSSCIRLTDLVGLALCSLDLLVCLNLLHEPRIQEGHHNETRALDNREKAPNRCSLVLVTGDPITQHRTDEEDAQPAHPVERIQHKALVIYQEKWHEHQKRVDRTGWHVVARCNHWDRPGEVLDALVCAQDAAREPLARDVPVCPTVGVILCISKQPTQPDVVIGTGEDSEH